MSFSFPALKVVETGSKRIMSTAANLVRPASPRTPRSPRSLTPRAGSLSGTPKAEFSNLMSPNSTPRSMRLAINQESMNQVNCVSPARTRTKASFAFPAAEPADSLSPTSKTYLDHLEGMRQKKAANFPKLKKSPLGAGKRVGFPAGRPLSAGRVMGTGNPTTRSLAAHIGGIVKNAQDAKPKRKNSQAMTQRRRKSVAAQSRSSRSFAAEEADSPEDRFRYLEELEALREKDCRAVGANYKSILGKMRALTV